MIVKAEAKQLKPIYPDYLHLPCTPEDMVD